MPQQRQRPAHNISELEQGVTLRHIRQREELSVNDVIQRPKVRGKAEGPPAFLNGPPKTVPNGEEALGRYR